MPLGSPTPAGVRTAAAAGAREPLDDRVGEAARAGRAAQVVGRVRPLGDDVADGRLDALGGRLLAQVAEHQDARQDHRRRVRLVLARVLGRRAVDRLEHRRLGPDVGAGRDAEAADEARAQVADDVAVQVRQHEHVVQVRLLDELHAHVVDDAVLELDPARVVGGDRAAALEEQAVARAS